MRIVNFILNMPDKMDEYGAGNDQDCNGSDLTTPPPSTPGCFISNLF